MTPSSRNLLCASILPRTCDELASLTAACGGADMLELRLDLLPDIDLSTARARAGRPCIATIRSREEGGYGTLSTDDVVNLLQKAVDAGMEFIDVEYAHAADILPRLQCGKTQIVLSSHTGERSAPALSDLARAMLAVPADVCKLVFTATHPDDALTAQMVRDIFVAAGRRCVVHAMGDEGRLSRLLGAVRGNAWTYVAADAGTATAPGQITMQDAVEYDLAHKQQNAALLGLLGWPTRYSKGRFLHNALLRRAFPDRPVPFLYVNFPTQQADRFWQAWNEHITGISITLPHKERIVPFLDYPSAEVETSGICNTAVRRNGAWYGYNTDMTALHTLLLPYRDRLAHGTLVAGTGGTARSAIAVLHRLGVRDIICTGRNTARGQELAERFGINFLPENQYGNRTFAAVLHTTPVGMAPRPQELPAVAEVLQQGMLVFDAVYNPPLTRLLAVARERSCTVISGVDMFLLQAAEQFRLFTGMDVHINDVRTVWEDVWEKGDPQMVTAGSTTTE